MHRFPVVVVTILISISWACGQVLSVHDIQFTTDPSGNSPYQGQTVTTGGIVTGVNFTAQPIRYFIADRGGGLWSGILVNDNQDRTLAIGDSVQLQAEVQESNTQTRLRNVVSGSFSRVAAAGSVPPVTVTSGSVSESAEGVLIEITDAVVIAVAGEEFTINDGSGPLQVAHGWPFAYAPLVGDTLSFIRGIVSSAANAYTLNPRGDGDFGFVGNRPPLISDVRHTPDVPTELQSDTVTAIVTDQTGVASAAIFYRFSEDSAFLERPMHDDGRNGDGTAGDGIWGGVIPAGPARSTCYFYVSATDSQNATGYSPPDAPAHTYSYLIRSSVLTIFDLQYTGNPTGGASPYDGQIVTVTGIVTGTEFGDQRDGFFMCDPGDSSQWSGIQVYAPSLTPALGDSVSVTGQVTEYYDLTEFTTGNRVTVLGSGTIPPPLGVRIGVLRDSAESYEGCLVHIGMCVVSNTDDWLAYNQFDVTDHTGTGTILGDFGLEYVPAVGDSFTGITGCVSYHSAVGWMVAPRGDDDLGLIDRRPPQLVSAQAASDSAVNLVFNERLSPEGVENTDHYRVVDQSELIELHVQAAYLFSSARTIQLSLLERLQADHAYSVTVAGIRDLAGNVLRDTTVGFTGYQTDTTIVLIRDIYERFDSLSGRTITLLGVVNFVEDVTTSSGSRRISAYMQDHSGRGLNLSQTGPASTYPGIQRGNLIKITGQLAPYQGSAQLGAFTSANITVLGENQPLFGPDTVRTGDRTTQHALIATSSPGVWGSGTWCQTTGTIIRVDENVGGGSNVQIDDGTGNLTIRVWDSMNLDSVRLDTVWYRLRDLTGKVVTVRGPASMYSNDFQMLAGYAEDFFLPRAAEAQASDALWLDVPNRPFAPDLGQTIRIRYNAPRLSEVRLRVFDLRGRVVRTWDQTAGGGNEIEWDGTDPLHNILPLGTYILHLESVQNGNSRSTVKPVVIGTRL